MLKAILRVWKFDISRCHPFLLPGILRAAKIGNLSVLKVPLLPEQNIVGYQNVCHTFLLLEVHSHFQFKRAGFKSTEPILFNFPISEDDWYDLTAFPWLDSMQKLSPSSPINNPVQSKCFYGLATKHFSYMGKFVLCSPPVSQPVAVSLVRLIRRLARTQISH